MRENQIGIDLNVLLDDVIDRYRIAPVDLMNIGDADGEYHYILNSRASYLRTIQDVVEVINRSAVPARAKETKILELGSYLGVVSIALAELGYSVTAADIPEFMQNSRLVEKFQRSGVHWLYCNLRDYKLPVDAEKYDLVIMCETLEHLNFNPLPVLAEINRVLVTGGHVYISLPNLASLVNRVRLVLGQSIHNPVSDFFSQLERESNMIVGIHWREYTKSEIAEILSAMGFDLIRHYYFTSTKSHFLAKWLYCLFPQLKPNQTVVARKNIFFENKFHLTAATTP